MSRLQFQYWGRDLLPEGETSRTAAAFADSLQPGASSMLSSSQLSDLQMMLDVFPAYSDDGLKDSQVGRQQLSLP